MTMMADSLERFFGEVPTWPSIPPTAIYLRLEEELIEAKVWAFRCHSKKHEEEWQKRSESYLQTMAKMQGSEKTVKLHVLDELGKCLLVLMGGFLALATLAIKQSESLEAIDEEKEEINLSELLKTLLEHLPENPQLATPELVNFDAAGASFTGLTLALEQVLRGPRKAAPSNTFADEHKSVQELALGLESKGYYVSWLCELCLSVALTLAGTLFGIALIRGTDEDLKQQIEKAAEGQAELQES